MMQLYPESTIPSTVTNTVISDLPQALGSIAAKNYQTRPNTRDVIFDSEENYFYMRVTDIHGKIVDFKRFSYDEAPEPKPEDIFVTRDDFNALKEEFRGVMGGINDVKELISNITAATANNIESGQEQYSSNKPVVPNGKNFNRNKS